MLHCSHCDAQYLKWQGRCTECGKWGTISKEEEISSIKKPAHTGPAAKVLDLSQAKKEQTKHQPTGISELDRVLSGGIVPGSVTLLAGEPGIGKSTLVAQLAGAFAAGRTIVGSETTTPTATSYYVSGEESEGQVLMRFERLRIDPAHIAFSNSVDVGAVIAAAKKSPPSFMVIDSIQTMCPSGIENLPGTPTAVRAATAELIECAKSTGIPVLLIGQVTKDGSVAGPKTLEHLVDTVLTLEGDEGSPYRLLRCAKNRFGSTEEVGVFEMTEHGMETVENPSARFLEERANTPGSVITCIMEGTRPFLVEIQALAEKSYFANPVRRTSGFDASRLQMLLAIVSKRAGVNVSQHDVYVNVIGGMKLKEHAVDLAVCAAVISSVQEKKIAENAIVVGELGLGGEVRSVPFLERRIKEAERLGIKNALTPKTVKHISEL